MQNSNKRQNGFTMIELMIVVAIVAVIASIGIPSYRDQVIKSKRSAAKIGLLKYAQMQESYFVQNLSYAKSFKNEDGGLKVIATGTTVNSEHGLYAISLTATPAGCNGLPGANSCGGFTLVATPQNGQEADKVCASYDLNNVGQKRAKKYGDTEYSTAQAEHCW